MTENIHNKQSPKKSFMPINENSDQRIAPETSILGIENEHQVFVQEENFPLAIAVGLTVSLLCIILWTTITTLTLYQISYMAIGVGVAIGYAIQKIGKGKDIKYNILGALLSITTCILGNLVSYICIFCNDYNYTYLQVFSELDFETARYVMISNFQVMDIIFYGIAIYTGFTFATISLDE